MRNIFEFHVTFTQTTDNVRAGWLGVGVGVVGRDSFLLLSRCPYFCTRRRIASKRRTCMAFSCTARGTYLTCKMDGSPKI